MCKKNLGCFLLKIPGKFNFLMVLGLLFSVITIAQNRTGKLTGKITDSATNLSLSGVSISPKGTTKGTASINDGSYILTLAPGTYTIVYSYTGYATKPISEIEIKAGATTFLDIILRPRIKDENVVVVIAPRSAKRETAAAVYNKQKLSGAASDGIGAESIAKTPDPNAAAILKRVTGVNVVDNRFVVVRGMGAQYNQTMLNGVAMTSTETNQNAFSFDLIPAAVIDNIVVNKTATPDMPGNFAGGIVQVNTKDFPAKAFFSVAIQAGFSDQTYGNDFYSDKIARSEWLGFKGKGRELPDGFPQTGIDRVGIGNVNAQERIRLLKTLPNNLVPVNQGPSGLNESMQLGYGKTIKFSNNSQFGFIAAITQRKSELIEKEIILRDPVEASFTPAGKPQFSQYSQNTRNRFSSEFSGVLNLAYNFGTNKITLKNIFSNVFRNNFIKRDSLFLSTLSLSTDDPLEGYSYLSEERRLINSILSGEHRTGKNNETRLDWNVNITGNNTTAPDTRNFVFIKDQKNRYTTYNQGVRVTDALRLQSRFWTKTKDLIAGGAFNLSSIFDWLGQKQIVKGGLLFQNRRRQSFATVLPYNGFSKPYLLDSILDPLSYGTGDNSIDINVPLISNFSEAGLYNAATALQASYASMENKLGKKTRVIWGVRIENYQQSVNVYRPVFYDNFLQPEYIFANLASRSSIDILPSINVVYSPRLSTNIRLAYSNTVIRPDLKDLAPFTRMDFQTFQLSTGNARLKSTSVTNYDLKLEWFPSSGEILSVGAFYKKLVDPIEYGQTNEQNVDVGVVAINSGNATIRGVEAEFRKKIDFIKSAPWLQNVTLFGNGTLVKSLVKESAVDNFFLNFFPEHRLTGQSDYTVNMGISVAAFKNSFEVTLSYNKSGDLITQLGSSRFESNPPDGKPRLIIPHYILQARDLMDLVIRQSFFKRKGQIKLNVSNLLAKPTLVYEDFNGNNKQDNPFRIDRTVVGAGFVIDGTDNISSLTNGQRTYSISFTYTF
jgi:outer membrane receptor protein involved in Fe transport